MPELLYERWIKNFSEEKFTSEDSMRDYLAKNPKLLFPEFSITIREEKYLPKSTLPKCSGQADLIVCRFIDYDAVLTAIDISNIETWIVELKKVEASYENGFEQLLDYMTVLKNDHKIQQNLKQEIKRKIEAKAEKKTLKLQDAPLTICGALVAPSFDLIGRGGKIDGKGTDWEILRQELKKGHKYEEGFTLFDAVSQARKIFPQISLIKLIRFRRGDETIFYTENALGQTAAVQTRRFDPTILFNKDYLQEDQIFFFRDSNGKEYRQVKCTIPNEKGEANAFKVIIRSIEGYDEMPAVKKYLEDHAEFVHKKLPYKNTAKRCSMALHKLYQIFDEREIVQNYGIFGENNFVRESDEKTLLDLKEEYLKRIASS